MANDQIPLLKVCLPQNSPPYARHTAKGSSGFDVEFSRELADKLQRKLEIIWFESEDDDESAYDLEVNALLTSNLCSIAPGFPLYQPLLEEPVISKVQLPEIEGSDNKKRDFVTISRLIPSLPYHFAPLTVLLNPSIEEIEIKHLKDLQDHNIGSEEGTLADVLLMSTARGLLVPNLHHFVPGKDIFQALEKGQLDAVLIEQHRFDAYRNTHPNSQIKETAYTHAIGFNMGVVTSEAQADLLEEINPVISEMIASASMQQLANVSGMRYFEPRSPAVRPRLNPMALISD